MYVLPIILVAGMAVAEHAWMRILLVLVFVLVRKYQHERELDRAFNGGYEATIAAFGVAGEQIANLQASRLQAESSQDALQVLQ